MVLKGIKKRVVELWFDKLKFIDILLLWILVISLFGAVYFYSRTESSYLYNNLNNVVVNNVKDSIYFSFIAGTTTGFGDIIPVGIFKVLSVIEVTLGLLLLAVVTSKFVSLKQNIILEELYEFSFNDKISKFRSSLLLFRQNLERLILKAEDGSIKKREVNESYITISHFEDVLTEFLNMINKKSSSSIIKTIDPVNAELILNSIIHSFEKLLEFITAMEDKKLEWKREITVHTIKSCMHLSDLIFKDETLINKVISNIHSKELEERRNKLISKIQEKIV